jgi:hypothetical protein
MEIMKRFAKKLFTIALLISIVNVAFADRGTGKKNKSKVLLNINTNASLKSVFAFNVKSGLSYKGSLLSRQPVTNTTAGSAIMSNSIVTYQKGNVTYIIPYKHKIAVPEIRQGYTGVKIILRSH